MARLIDVAEITAGQSPKSEYYNSDGIGTPFFQGNADFGIINPKVRIHTTKITKKSYKDDILISVRAPVGALNINNIECCIGRGLAAIKCRENLNKMYTYYFLHFFRRELKAQANGAIFEAITIDQIKNIEIPLPPLSIQKAIAEKLDKADALRKKDKELLAQYDELAQAIFIDMFGDPVKNEKGWDITKVEEVCSKIYGGGTPSKSKPEYYDGDIPWVTPKDMKYDYIVDSRDHINEDAVTNSSTKLIPVDSLLMVIRSGILKHTLPLGINKVEVTINQDMKAFIPNLSKTNSIFLKGFFKAVEAYLLTKVRAVTADNFEFSQIKELNFPLVPLKLQTQFEKKIKNIEAQKAIVKQQAQQSEDLFQALLQESFN